MTTAAPRREAHAHLAQHGRAMAMADLSGCRTVADALARLADQPPEGDRPGAWVLAHGLRVEALAERRWPTREELDRAVPGRPLCAWSFDYHALAANTAGLEAAGVLAGSVEPEGGVIVRDPSGEPTGVLLERAALDLWAKVPEPRADARRSHVRSACTALAALGFTEVHDLKSQTWLGPTLAELDASGELPLRAVLYPLVGDLAATVATRGAWESDRIRLGGGKVFVDGTLNSRTALMLEPYEGGISKHPRGIAMMQPAHLDTALRACREAGVGLAAHAIGDGAVRMVLDATERAGWPRTPDREGLDGRVRVEHAELIDESDVPRFEALGVAASVQPCHLLADMEALARSLPHRLHRVLPLRDLIRTGLTPGVDLVFGSDVPIVRANPEDSVQAAVCRTRAGVDAPDPITIEQALTEDEAWACFSSADSGGCTGGA